MDDMGSCMNGRYRELHEWMTWGVALAMTSGMNVILSDCKERENLSPYKSIKKSCKELETVARNGMTGVCRRLFLNKGIKWNICALSAERWANTLFAACAAQAHFYTLYSLLLLRFK